MSLNEELRELIVFSSGITTEEEVAECLEKENNLINNIKKQSRHEFLMEIERFLDNNEELADGELIHELYNLCYLTTPEKKIIDKIMESDKNV